MRTAIFENDHQIQYPDAVCFCFNPQEITIQTDSIISISISANGETCVDNRHSNSRKVYADISYYMRSFFSISENLLESIFISVEVSSSTDSFSFTTHCIWGAINIGEVFNDSRIVTWFRNFPFTFSLFIEEEGTTVSVCYDGNEYKTKSLPAGLNHINVSEWFPFAKEFVVIGLEGNRANGTFDYTFDYTFGIAINDGYVNKIVIDNSKCGIYLRWIDRHGVYQYWLFQEGDNMLQIETDGELLYQDYSDDRYSYWGVNRYHAKIMQKTIKACATLVDWNTINMLSTLCSSPLVDLYFSRKWIPVKLSNKTFTRSWKPLQNFEIEIVLPEIISQRL